MISSLGMREREREKKEWETDVFVSEKKICHFYIDEDKCFLQAHVLVNKRNVSWDYG